MRLGHVQIIYGFPVYEPYMYPQAGSASGHCDPTEMEQKNSCVELHCLRSSNSGSLLDERLLFGARVPVQGLGDAVHPILAVPSFRQHIGKGVARRRYGNVVTGVQFNSVRRC